MRLDRPRELSETQLNVLSAVAAVLVFALSFLAPMVTPSEMAQAAFEPLRPSPVLVLMAALAAVTVYTGIRFPLPLFIVSAIGWLLFSMWAPALIASLYAALSYRRTWQAASYLVAATLIVAVPIFVGAESLAYGLRVSGVMVLLMVALPFVSALWVRTRRRLINELRERNSRLESEQNARTAQAQAEERARIAREMHDVVAHQVALMVLRAGALEVSASATNDSRTASEASLIAVTGRAALSELRQVLGLLRNLPSPSIAEPFLAKANKLVAQTRAAGTPVTLDVEGPLDELPAAIELATLRIIQEALTNVTKHAPGARTTVMLRCLPATVDIRVTNGPGETAQPLPSSGLGLLGLRERAELLHGTLQTHRTPDGGFVVHSTLPTATVD